MTTFGHLTVIRRNGLDGSKLPLKTDSCLIGRSDESDVRVQLPNVSLNHCRIDVLQNGEISLINLSDVNPTIVNGNKVIGSVMITHGDVFTIGDRSFRWEFPKSSLFYNTKRKGSSAGGVSPSSSAVKRRSSNENKSKSKGKSPATISPAKKKRRLTSLTPYSRKKVSFGPALSPEQFELSLPVSSPLKKGGRPSSRRPSAPSFYGNPILTPVVKVTRPKRSSSDNKSQSNDSVRFSKGSKSGSSSPADASGESKTPETKKSPLMNRKSSSAKKNASFVCKRKSKSMSPAGGRSGTKKDRFSFTVSSPSKSNSVRMLLGLENAVKIVAPASPDSKKSAALRTIHAGKLKLKRSKSAQYIGKLKKKMVRRHSYKTLKVQMPFGRVTPMKDVKVRGKRSASLDKTKLSRSLSEDYKSPNISNEVFVSPLNTPSSNAAMKSSAVKRLLGKGKRLSQSLESDSLNLSGVEALLQTPTPPKATSVKKVGRKKKSYEKKANKSPLSDYTNVVGVKRLLRTPRNSLKPDHSDVRLMRSVQKSPKSDYSDVSGVKRLMKSPQKSPKSDYLNVFGLKRLMRTPQVSPKADYSDVRGVKRLMKTPRKSPVCDYHNVEGIDRLFRRSKSPRTSGGVVTSLKKLSPARSPNTTASTSQKVVSPVAKTPKLKTPKSTRGLDIMFGSVGRLTRSAAKRTAAVDGLNTSTTTPKIKTPTSAKRVIDNVSESGKKSKRSPGRTPKKVETPKSTTKSLKNTSPALVQSSKTTSPPSTKRTRQADKENVETPVVVTPKNTPGRKRKVETTPKMPSPSPSKVTKTTRKTATNKKAVEVEEITMNARTRSKRVVTFVEQESKSPKPTKGKRGAAKKSESVSNLVASPPVAEQTKRETRAAVTVSPSSPGSPSRRAGNDTTPPKSKKATPKPKKVAKKPSSKASVSSPKAENAVVASPKKTKKSPKPRKQKSPIVTRTSLRRKAKDAI